MITGLRRSALYVPCDRERMLEKSVSIPADVLLLNLEDGVSRAKKDEARDNAARALRGLDFGEREVIVRINSLATETGLKDLNEIVPCAPDGICLPKVERRKEIREADAAIRVLEAACGLPPDKIKLHAMIESAAGVVHAAAIAAGCSRMASLLFGSADYVKDLHSHPGPDRGELVFALQMIVTAARAAGIDALDAPAFDFRNEDLLRRESIQARRLGYDGKTALHPAQISVIQEVFDITPEETAWAKRIMAELDLAEERGRALSVLEGRLVENPHRAAAERILHLAEIARRRREFSNNGDTGSVS